MIIQLKILKYALVRWSDSESRVNKLVHQCESPKIFKDRFCAEYKLHLWKLFRYNVRDFLQQAAFQILDFSSFILTVYSEQYDYSFLEMEIIVDFRYFCHWCVTSDWI